MATIVGGCGGTDAGTSGAGFLQTTLLHSYPGDGASKQELARWMGAGAYAAGLPPELPVMAALVESDLKNLGYGDSDSVGYFQIPARIWNKGDYAGYPSNPQLQVKWFVDQALLVRKQRAAVGIDLEDESSWGEWIADVERPAAQYRGRHQLRLEEARRLLAR